jgi:hypothetical protein
MASNPLFDMLDKVFIAPGDYLRGAISGQGLERMDPSSFNRNVGLPSNMATDFLTGAVVDPFFLGGTLAGLSASKKFRGVAREFMKDEAGSLGMPGAGKGRMTIKGEYWLDDLGMPTFADGDVGDYNHEAIARMHAQREVIGKHPKWAHLAERDEPDFEKFMQKLAKEYNLPESVATSRVKTSPDWLGSDNMEDVQTRQAVEKLLGDLGIDESLWNVAANLGNRDPRHYASQVWGWTRMAGNTLETHGMDSTKLKKIASGISEAAVDMEEEDYARQIFDIYDHKTGKFYAGVPMDVLETGNMKALRDYQEGINRGSMGKPKSAQPSQPLQDIPGEGEVDDLGPPLSAEEEMLQRGGFARDVEENLRVGGDWLAQHYKNKIDPTGWQVTNPNSGLPLWRDKGAGRTALADIANRRQVVASSDKSQGTAYASYAKAKEIGFDLDFFLQNNPDIAESFGVHEHMHKLTRGNGNLHPKLLDYLVEMAVPARTRYNDWVDAEAAKVTDLAGINDLMAKAGVRKQSIDYYTDPTEVMSRVAEVRRGLESLPEDVVKKSLSGKGKAITGLLAENEGISSRVFEAARDLTEYFGDDGLRKLLKNVPVVLGMAGGGAVAATQGADGA